MKSQLRFALLVTAVISIAATFLSAATQETPKASAHTVGSVAPKNGSLVSRGQTPEQVIECIGIPARKLTSDIWVFPGFDAGNEQSNKDDCTLLLVTFAAGRVTDLKLINKAAETILAARFQERADKKVQLAGKRAD